MYLPVYVHIILSVPPAGFGRLGTQNAECTSCYSRRITCGTTLKVHSSDGKQHFLVVIYLLKCGTNVLVHVQHRWKIVGLHKEGLRKNVLGD